MRRFAILKKILFCISFICVCFSLSYAETGGKSAGIIAFTANIDRNWDLFIAKPNGTDLKRLTSTPFDERTPSWSPDRKKIVYSVSDGTIKVINIESKEIESLSLSGYQGNNVQPVFSHDGKRIIYVNYIAGETDDTDLMIYDIENKETKPFSTQRSAQFYPNWSPDGREIVYASVLCSFECGHNIQELWIAKSSGKHARQLLMTDSLSMQPVWSPDGKEIAFSSDKGGDYNIWVLDYNKGLLKQITRDPALDMNPVWSPDGKKMAFVSTRSKTMNIWIKNLDSGELIKFNPFNDKAIECKDISWK